MPVLPFEFGIFAYGVAVAEAPLPLRGGRVYTIADSIVPDSWALVELGTKHRMTTHVLPTAIVDQGLRFVPEFALLSGTPSDRWLIKTIVARWAPNPPISIADLYQMIFGARMSF